MKHLTWLALAPLLIAGSIAAQEQPVDSDVASAAADPIDIGSRRELFVDRFMIDRMDGARLKMHEPRLAPRGANPRPNGHYATMLKDGDLFRFYYRGDKKAGTHWRKDGWEAYHLGELTLYAESRDGRNWTEPDLGLYEFERYPSGNVVLADEFLVTHNFTPFIDTRRDIPAEQRYKALGGLTFGPRNEALREKYGPGGLKAFVSADGIDWKPLRDEPVIPEAWGGFDSQNVAFWSESEGMYVCYFRTIKDGLRSIGRTTSRDFVEWTAPEDMNANAPGEHLYTNGTQPYFRAPHIYIALPTRFQAKRGSTTDVMLMSSRGGNRYDRTFKEAFIRPGVGKDGWGNRSNYAAIGIHQTGPYEMSICLTGSRRYTLRLDGFSSVHAGYERGEMVTRRFTFKGDALETNHSTSAGGLLLVEIQDADGTALAGYELDNCQPIVGDQIDKVVEWKGAAGSDLSELEGRTIRLRFVMEDADLFSFRFR